MDTSGDSSSWWWTSWNSPLLISLVLVLLLVSTIGVLAYTDPGSGDASLGDYLEAISFADIDHTSGNNGGYADFSDTQVAIVQQGESLTLEGTLGTGGGSYTEALSVWFDWNDNNTFESSERTDVGNCDTELCTVSTTINVPADAAQGERKFRAIQTFSSSPTSPTTFTDDDDTYGEAEDYGLLVVRYEYPGAGNTGSGEYIESVSFDTMTHTSGDNSGYANFAENNSAVVTRGESYNFEATLMTGGFTEHLSVWFDWNGNEVFDSGERVDVGSCGSDGCTVSTTIDVPSDATPGEWQFRAIQNYNAWPTSSTAFADGDNYGEAEDYGLHVQEIADETAPTIGGITDPTGGSAVPGGEDYTVQWVASDTGSGISSFDLEYSTDGGSSWSTIQNGIPGGDRSYEWSVPATTSTEARLRLTGYDQAGNNASFTTGDFTIDDQHPSVSLSDPSGGEVLGGGSTFTTNWTASDNPSGFGSFSLEYSPDNGSTWNMIQNNIASGDRSYDWTVPSTTSSQSLLRITATDRAGNSTTDSSNVFSVDATEPTVTVTSPSSSSFLEAGTNHDITWDAPDAGPADYDSFDIEYSPDNGSTWNTVQTGIGGGQRSYTWSVPANTTSEGIIRVTAHDDVGNSGSDESGTFSIWESDNQTPQVNITYPTSGADLGQGNNYDVEWNAPGAGPSGYESFDIEYSSDGGASWSNLQTGIDGSARSYTWNVTQAQTQQAQLRVTAHDNAGNSGSDQTGNFNLDATAPSVSLTNPTGGETFFGNDNVTIEWDATDGSISGYESFDIQYSNDGGSSWNSVETELDPTTRSYDWTVPFDSTSQGRVRVVANSNADLSNSSTSGDFTINVDGSYLEIGEIPEAIQGNSTYEIQWEGFNIANYEVSWMDHAANDGLQSLDSYTTSESFTWNVPDVNTEKAQIRVQGEGTTGNNNQTKASDIFTIDSEAPNVTLTEPNSSSALQGGEDFTIAWTASDNGPAGMDTYTLRYSMDGGSSWETIIEDKGGHARQHVWTVPDVTTTDAVVEILAYDKAGNMTQDDSINSPMFTIDSVDPEIYLIESPGEGTYEGGNEASLKWVTKEAGPSGFDTFAVEYSTNGGDTWYTVADDFETGPRKHEHNFTLPDIPTTEAKLRVSATDGAGNISHYASDPFTVNSEGADYTLRTPDANAFGGTVPAEVLPASEGSPLGRVTVQLNDTVIDTVTESPYKTNLNTTQLDSGETHALTVTAYDGFGNRWDTSLTFRPRQFSAGDKTVLTTGGDSVVFRLPVSTPDGVTPVYSLTNESELSGDVEVHDTFPKLSYRAPEDRTGTEPLTYRVDYGSAYDTGQVLLDVRSPAKVRITQLRTIGDTPLTVGSKSKNAHIDARITYENTSSAPAAVLPKSNDVIPETNQGESLSGVTRSIPSTNRVSLAGNSDTTVRWNVHLPSTTKSSGGGIVLRPDTDVIVYDRVLHDTKTGVTLGDSMARITEYVPLFSSAGTVDSNRKDGSVDTTVLEVGSLTFEAGVSEGNNRPTPDGEAWIDTDGLDGSRILTSITRFNASDTRIIDTDVTASANPGYSFLQKSSDDYFSTVNEATRELTNNGETEPVPGSLLQVSLWKDRPGDPKNYLGNRLNEDVLLTIRDLRTKNPQSLKLAKLDTATERWTIVDSNPTVNNENGDTYVATFRVDSTTGFSVFRVFENGSSVTDTGKADETVVYPNPFVPFDRDPETGAYGASEEDGIHFGAGKSGSNVKGFPRGTTVRIFTVNGNNVAEFRTTKGGVIRWDARTRNGDPAASGVYFYVLDVPDGGQATGKFSIVR